MFTLRSKSIGTNEILLNLSFGAFVRDAGQYVIWVIMTVYLSQARHLSYLDIGTVFLIAGLASFPIAIAGGNLIDRIGRRTTAVVLPWVMSTISVLEFFLIFNHAGTLYIIILLIAGGPVQAMQWVTLTAIVADVTAISERISGFSTLRIASNIGIGVGLVMGGFLSEFNYAYVFLLSIFGSVAEGIIYYLRVPETSPGAMASPGPRKREKIFIPIGDTLFVAVSLVIAATWFFSGMFESALTPLYMSSVDRFSTFSITVLFAINTAVVIFCQTPINRILRMTRDSVRIVLGLILYASAYFVFAEVSFYGLIAAAVVLLTLGENIESPAANSLITKIAPENNRGAYLGFNSSITSLVNPFRPFVATLLLTATVPSPDLSWVFISSVTFAMALIFMIAFGTANIRRSRAGRDPI